MSKFLPLGQVKNSVTNQENQPVLAEGINTNSVPPFSSDHFRENIYRSELVEGDVGLPNQREYIDLAATSQGLQSRPDYVQQDFSNEADKASSAQELFGNLWKLFLPALVVAAIAAYSRNKAPSLEVEESKDQNQDKKFSEAAREFATKMFSNPSLNQKFSVALMKLQDSQLSEIRENASKFKYTVSLEWFLEESKIKKITQGGNHTLDETKLFEAFCQQGEVLKDRPKPEAEFIEFTKIFKTEFKDYLVKKCEYIDQQKKFFAEAPSTSISDGSATKKKVSFAANTKNYTQSS